MALSVSPTARDIVFNFKDSCNCCKPKKPEDRHLYVNSYGELEKYKRSKTMRNTARAFDRSLLHLHTTINEKVMGFDGVPAVFQRKIGFILGSINAKKNISLMHVESINNLLILYLCEISERKLDQLRRG